MKVNVDKFFTGNNILVLGFGMEGRSTVRFLKSRLPSHRITIADKNEHLQLNDEGLRDCKFILGNHYLEQIDQYDHVIKSPGIPNHLLHGKISLGKLTSQTDLFLKLFRDRTVGITGTKGKSTTSSLIHCILKLSGFKVFLLGNIGKPPLDFVDKIEDDTIIIFEMSSHQLDGIHISPHFAVFLNLFEEHLDHYKDIQKYRMAKNNIFHHLGPDDWLIYNGDDKHLLNDISNPELRFNKLGFSCLDPEIFGAHCSAKGFVEFKGRGESSLFDFSQRAAMPGRHNLMNIMASVCVSKLLSVQDEVIIDAITNFPGLEHRLEYVGKFKDIHFYNDSIATIPEATIEAIKTLGKVATLILGGKDRGINYSELASFIMNAGVHNIILIGEVGLRLKIFLEKESCRGYRLFVVNSLDEMPEIIRTHTPLDGICLLSPAASSYDMFSNFEERGQAFKKMAENI